MKFTVIIAAYNEEKHIARVVREVAKQKPEEIVVVSDGSTDRTVAEAVAAGATVLEHVINQGKGAALKTGADYAVKRGAKYLVFLDGDGQHDPREIPAFLKELKNHDVVFGTRKREGQMPFLLRFGNWFISKVIELLYGIKIHDSQGGYRAMTTKAYKLIRWHARDYSVESEMIAHTGRAKLKYCEIPVKTIYHDAYKGTSPLDGLVIVANLIIWK
ncbi:glycosyltransferase family 2 protein, partial [Candidatus Woesearchaeota archaeon]